MPVHLAIHPCWSWRCPHCIRRLHYPTMNSVGEKGVQIAYDHLLNQHIIEPEVALETALGNWAPDHWPRLTSCT